MAKLSRAIAATASLALLHFCLGCGSGLVQVEATPAINQVIPQTIAAGSKNLTIKVSGTNFTSDSVILWNGTAIATSVVDSNTLSSPLASNIVATPSTVQLQVQNTNTKASSSSVPVVITTPANGASVSPLSLLTTSLPQSTQGTAYSVALAASGGTPAYSWMVTGGQLPSGLSLSATTGVISGAPTSNGIFSFTITVTDSSSPAQTAAMQFGLTVPPPVSTPPPPTVPTPLQITPSLPAGVVGSIYSGSLQVSGGTAPYTWSSSALPEGLSLGSNGVVSGDPTSSGSTSVTFTVSDSSIPAQTDSVALPLSIAPSFLTISSVKLPSGTDGSAYTAALSATGGTAPYAWSVSGLPAGLSLSSNGIISGTPTATGNFSLAVTVADSQNPAKTASAILPLSVSSTIAPLTITSTAVGPGTSNQPYTSALSATGGNGPYTWSVSGLPAGLSLGGNGVISGTPTATGNFSLAVIVTDSQSPAKTASANLPLSVTATIAPLTITSTAVAGAISNQPYGATLSATGGTAPYTWSVSGLPAGLILGSNGVISGTPTATGNFSLAVTVTDSQSPAKTASVNLPLSVTAAIAPLTITSTAVAGATSNQPYSTTLSATGGTAPYIWSVSGLPAGLSLSSNGIISGTPTATGNFSLAVTVTDSQSPAKTASASLPLSVTAAIAPLTITSATLAGATSSKPYSTTLSAIGGTAPYTWSVSGLPAGLSLGGNGVISGTPTTTGNFSLAVTVTDSQSPAKTASASLPLSVTAAIAPLTITSTAVAGATSNQPYSTTLSATGGTAPYTWSVTGLPTGLSLGGNGVISGTPTATGNFSLAVTVTDSQSPAKTASASLPLSVTATIAPLTITSTAVAGATSNQPYSTTLSATGGTAPYTWSVSGLPAGLSLGGNGVIAGTPTAAGNFSLAVTVTDSQSPAKTASASLPLSVTAAIAPLTITSTAVAGATSNQPYSATLSATGGTAPYTWSITGLPAGLSLGGNGVISGTPTATGNFSLTVTVTDSQSPAKTASANLPLSVTAAIAPLTITSTAVAGATSNQSYSATLSATGGTAPYTWSVSGLPTGLSLSSNGVISGTPTTTGNFSLAVTVTDSQSPAKTASATIPLVVTVPPLTITSSTLPSGTDGTAYSGTLQASGGTPAYTWSISTGSLPAGLTLAATTGVISGTPSVTGTTSFTATVSDNGNPVQTKSVSVSITLSAAQPPPGPGTTWYIRADGGTNTQCTGKTNAAYPGSGTGQACAFNHPYQMLNYSGGWANMAGGDTIQFADSSSAAHTYYMGEQNAGVGTDWHTQLGGLCAAANVGGGAGSSCILPAPPSGTAAQHTRILGQNAGSCHDSAHTHLVNPTVLSGIDNAFAVLDTRGTNYVDISCIEITQPDTCTNTVGAGQCGSNANYVHYGGLILNYGTDQGPSNLTLQDVAVVGIAGSGILGSHLNKSSSDVFSATDVYVIGNGGAGWNGDGGGCGTSCETVGTMNISYATIDWNGCVAVEPYDMTKPDTQNAFNYCYGQSDGGYGDGFVQIAAGNMSLNVDHSYFRWNTQDGFDGLHLSDDVKTAPAIHISTSWSEGNAGATFKIGAGASSTAINNVSISNCRVLTISSAFPLNPSGWTLDGADSCRAAGDEWSFQENNGTVITMENNTSVGYGTTMYDVGCAALAPNCFSNGATFIFKNNISKGYPDPGNGNRLASGFYFGMGNPFANAGSVADHNLWSTMDEGCPDSTIGIEKIYTCADPGLVAESDINHINPNLTSSSPAINSGIAISGITTDFNGTTRPNPPAIGAMEP
ncbi:putative Ig domain-containing protein [Tunturibacter psychrotolerans]|uniref:Ig domain-containing protein n=1 Tax=Tunturiibacter psychrotolerans TaxID=3069686 RepID=A0AAU7ZPF3_9BACT